MIGLLGLLDLDFEATDWMTRGTCAQSGGDGWFPEKGDGPQMAKRVCRFCPVRTECLEYALANDERWGVWGGLSERERRAAKRTRRQPEQPLEVAA